MFIGWYVFYIAIDRGLYMVMREHPTVSTQMKAFDDNEAKVGVKDLPIILFELWG